METLLLLVWSGGSRLCMVILTTSLIEIHLPTNSGYVSEDVIRVLDFPKTVNADEAIIENYLVEFLQIASLETMKQFLVFATGAPCLPNFGLGKIEIKYDNVTSIFASTCLKSITFPQKFPDKVTFSCSVEAVLSSTTTSFNQRRSERLPTMHCDSN